MAPECVKTRLRASISQKFFWGSMPPDPPNMGHLCGSHMGFLHKLGNPLPQILDPPLVVIVLINFQTYKTSVSYYTDIDASYLILFSLHFTMINGNNIFSIKSQVFFTRIFYGLATLSGIIPIIYVIALHLMYSRWIFGKKIC